MHSLAPWAVGVSELVARPVSRGRAQGLGRLTAPTHGRWFWAALWTASAVASFVVLIPALFDRGPPVPTYELMHTLGGVAFAACGLVALELMLVAWTSFRQGVSPVRTILCAAGAVAALYGCRYFYRRTLASAHEPRPPRPAPPAVPPDFSTLGDGSQAWKNLERMSEGDEPRP